METTEEKYKAVRTIFWILKVYKISNSVHSTSGKSPLHRLLLTVHKSALGESVIRSDVISHQIFVLDFYDVWFDYFSINVTRYLCLEMLGHI